jgi:hypothetical protein
MMRLRDFDFELAISGECCGLGTPLSLSLSLVICFEYDIWVHLFVSVQLNPWRRSFNDCMNCDPYVSLTFHEHPIQIFYKLNLFVVHLIC